MTRMDRQPDGSYLLEYDGRHYDCKNLDEVLQKLEELEGEKDTK